MADFPSNPSNGNTHIIGNTVWVYNSTSDSWLIQDVTEYAVAHVGTSAPTNVQHGSLWFDTGSTGRLHVYVNGSWVYANPGAVNTIIAGAGIDVTEVPGSATLSHSDTSSISGTKGSTADLTKIDTITIDGNGHVTAVATGPIGHSDTSSISGTKGNTGNTTKIDKITVDANGHVTAVTTGAIGHSNTSNLSGTYGSTSDGTKIDTITVDANGHVTAIATGPAGGGGGSGSYAVGDIAVGRPKWNYSSVTHSAGTNYAGSTISFGLSQPSGTWKCIHGAHVSSTFRYSDESYHTINASSLSIYERVS